MQNHRHGPYGMKRKAYYPIEDMVHKKIDLYDGKMWYEDFPINCCNTECAQVVDEFETIFYAMKVCFLCFVDQCKSIVFFLVLLSFLFL